MKTQLKNKPRFKNIQPLAYKESALLLLQQLNPEMDIKHIEINLRAMVEMPHYLCFGLFEEGQLIGLASGWTSVRVYCGKQLEIDNVIIDQTLQSKGLGKRFINRIKQWAIDHHYQNIALNTYVQNAPSHKFYFNQGFNIIGYHFELTLET